MYCRDEDRGLRRPQPGEKSFYHTGAGLVLCLPGSRDLRPGHVMRRSAYHLDPLHESRLAASAGAATAFAMVRYAKPSRVDAETVGTPDAARELCVEYPCFSTDTSVLMKYLFIDSETFSSINIGGENWFRPH